MGKGSSKKKELSPEEQSICNRFKQAAGRASNADIARAVEADASTVSRIRSIVRVPSLKTLIHFCRWRKVSADFILGLTEDREGWRFEADGIKSIGVAVLDSLEAITKSAISNKNVVTWRPFAEEDLEHLLGYRIEDPRQLAVVPDGTEDGYLLVDRWYKQEHVCSHETFIVKYDRKLSVCKIKIQEKGSEVVVICKVKGEAPFAVDFRRKASKSDVLIARVLRVYTSPDRSESWD